MSFNREIKGLLLVFVAGLLWGTIGVFVRLMSELGADAMQISFLRVALAFVVMLAVTVAKCGKSSLKIRGRQLLYSALLGIVCHGVYNIFYCIAVTLSGVAVSAVLLNIAPIATMLVSVVLFSEKLSIPKVCAVFVNVIGCALAVTGGRLSLADLSLVGICCGVGAGLCYAMTAIFGRLASNDTDSFVISTYSYLSASLVLLFPSKPWECITQQNISGILLLGVGLALIPTALAYVLYYKGVSVIKETSRVPVAASFETVVAAVLGFAIFGEKLNFVSIIGIVLVIASVVLMNLKRKTIGD